MTDGHASTLSTPTPLDHWINVTLGVRSTAGCLTAAAQDYRRSGAVRTQKTRSPNQTMRDASSAATDRALKVAEARTGSATSAGTMLAVGVL